VKKLNTSNTTRLPYDDPEVLSIAVSRLIYPTSHVSWRANSIIMIHGEDYRTIVPSVSLIHFPFNAPILVSNTPILSKNLVEEAMRLNPAGHGVPAKAMLIGNFSPSAMRQIHRLGYSTLHFNTPDPVIQSLHIIEWRMKILPDSMSEMITKDTFLVSLDTVEEAYPVFGFSAHMGTPILYTHRDELPELTKQFFRSESSRNVTIVGSEKSVSNMVSKELQGIVSGAVERVDGKSLPDLAVQFSKEKTKIAKIGWGRNIPMIGDAFTLFPSDWKVAMVASLLSHLGKHTPLLPIEGTRLPTVYKDYLDFLRPRGMHPQPPFMHAFLLGSPKRLTFPLQVEVEEKISFKETTESH
jgi:hypothetical protein